MMVKCNKCGKEVDKSFKFCPECGKKLKHCPSIQEIYLEKLLNTASILYLKKIVSSEYTMPVTIEETGKTINVDDEVTDFQIEELLGWSMENLAKNLRNVQNNAMDSDCVAMLVEGFFRDHKITCSAELPKEEDVTSEYAKDCMKFMAGILEYKEYYNHNWKYWNGGIQDDET